MELQTESLKQKASGKKKENEKFFAQLKRKKAGVLDAAFQQLHEKVFACTDCLQCANCCKTTGPLFTGKDIGRIANHLNLSERDFVEEYLRMDEDGDQVLRSVPCAFLLPDNRCGIYEVRPKACREYPHTNRRNMQGILDITYRNISVCPAVYEIVERLKGSIK